MLEGPLIISCLHRDLKCKIPLCITGIDLSPRMVSLANQQLNLLLSQSGTMEGTVEMKAEVGDAEEKYHLRGGSVDLLFSSFGLQQLGSNAPQVLANWCKCLNEGGLGLVVLWPSKAEEEGPWRAYQEAVDECNGAVSSATEREEWELNLLRDAMGLEGIEVLSDSEIKHEISWVDAEECWRVMTYGGPWNARRIRYGDQHMDELRRVWEKKLPYACQKAFIHHPKARQICIRKTRFIRNKL